jgi:GDP-mannose 6-dehydrogenase
MRISVFGLGYVGAVTAGCLSEQGHAVIGVDVHPQKIECFQQGQAPIVEPGLDALLEKAHERGLLKATSSCHEAIASSDASIVCVGTPSRNHGALDLSHVQEVTRQIGEALRAQDKKHLLFFRSTMLPGSTEYLVSRHLQDLVDSKKLAVFYYPEFLREGTAVPDFRDPSMSVLGVKDGAEPEQREALTLFQRTPEFVDWRTAEMVKYASNAFHATKITFANEIGRLGKEAGVNSQRVMQLLCMDTRLNLSPYYMKPGNPFGGSCLPKDVRAVCHFGREQGLTLPLLENLLPSNHHHLQSLLELISDYNEQEIIILGLSFKPNTDDLRESSMVEVAQNLLGHGYQLRIFDPQLNLAKMVGSNKRVIDLRMPHLATLLYEDLASAIGKKGLVLVSQKCAPIADLAKCLTPQHTVIDINGWAELKTLPSRYEGFCW